MPMVGLKVTKRVKPKSFCIYLLTYWLRKHRNWVGHNNIKETSKFNQLTDCLCYHCFYVFVSLSRDGPAVRYISEDLWCPQLETPIMSYCFSLIKLSAFICLWYYFRSRSIVQTHCLPTSLHTADYGVTHKCRHPELYHYNDLSYLKMWYSIGHVTYQSGPIVKVIDNFFWQTGLLT